MELMSSLLLFALTLLPQTLGESQNILSNTMRFNETTANKLRPRQNVLIKEPTVGRVSDLQSVFQAPTCKSCIICMEKAIKAHKIHNCVARDKTEAEILDNLTNEIRREKRKVDNGKKSVKKSKSKENKFITVFKYVDNGEVYALKVKESTHYNKNISKLETKCAVYKVQQSHSCEMPEAKIILKGSKINKESKTERIKKGANEQDATATTNMQITKQQMDLPYFKDSLSPPHYFMSSIEDMTY